MQLVWKLVKKLVPGDGEAPDTAAVALPAYDISTGICRQQKRCICNPKVSAVWCCCTASLIHSSCCFNTAMPPLSLCIFLPIAVAQRVLHEEAIVGAAYAVDVVLCQNETLYVSTCKQQTAISEKSCCSTTKEPGWYGPPNISLFCGPLMVNKVACRSSKPVMTQAGASAELGILLDKTTGDAGTRPLPTESPLSAHKRSKMKQRGKIKAHQFLYCAEKACPAAEIIWACHYCCGQFIEPLEQWVFWFCGQVTKINPARSASSQTVASKEC